MKIDRKKINKILLITLSNVGDIVLTTPVLGALSREFPKAKLDVMVGPRGVEIFEGHPAVHNVIPYDKFISLKEKQYLISKLKKNKYDLIVDLRNTLFPLLVGARYKTSPLHKAPELIKHKKDVHLWKLKSLGLDITNSPYNFHVSEEDRRFIDALLAKSHPVVISPGARSNIKRWKRDGFVEVADRLIDECKVNVVMVGDEDDKLVVKEIIERMRYKPVDLTGALSLKQLGALLSRSQLLITNDSAPMHIGVACGVPVLAIFGPTDPDKYGPSGEKNIIIRKRLRCAPCESAQCKFKHECMELIGADEVYDAAKSVLMQAEEQEIPEEIR